MKIFIVDIYVTGHHISYLRLFARAFQKLNFEVVFLLPNCREVKDADVDVLKSELSSEVFFFDLPKTAIARTRMESLDRLRQMWKTVGEKIKGVSLTFDEVGLVFFPYMDPFMGPYLSLSKLDSVFPYPWSGLIMNPQNCRAKMPYSWLRRSILSPHHLLKSKNCKAIFVFDRFCADLIEKETKKQVVVIPDVIDNVEPDLTYWLCKEVYNKANGRKVVSLLGSLSKRKGMLALLKTVDMDMGSDHLFLIAGKLDIDSFDANDLKNIKEIVERNPHKILYSPERIPTEADFNALVSISDIIYAAYIDFYASSNLITKAATFWKPILVSEGYMMEEIVEEYKLGVVIPQDSPGKILESLNHMRSEVFQQQFEKTNRINKFNEEHSEDFLREKLRILSREDVSIN